MAKVAKPAREAPHVLRPQRDLRPPSAVAPDLSPVSRAPARETLHILEPTTRSFLVLPAAPADLSPPRRDF
jgi:hypothetical protein